MQTRLMTIMFIDVQGFTKRTASQTLEETKVFIEETRTFVQEHLEKWNGKLIKTIGDGFLGSFEAPTSAIQAALEIQRKLEARNANILNPENFVRFRIGINTGEIAVDESGDVFGDPVNIAARIESFCEPNEVFISEATYLAINRNQFQLKDLGPQMFKNATREIRIYKILRHGPELGGASTLTAPKPSMKETVSGGGAHASESKTRLPANWAKIVGAIVAFLLIAALFRVALKKVLQRGKGSGSTATETVALPPLVPLPGLKNGQAPVLVPVPSLASVSAEPKPTAGPATMTSTDEDDEDLSGDEDLLADNPPGEKPMSDKRPRKPGFFKLFADGIKDRQHVTNLMKQGKIDEATQFCEKRYAELKAGGLKPPANAFVGLASMYKLAKQYDKALDTLERGVREHPQNKRLKKVLDDARAAMSKLRGSK